MQRPDTEMLSAVRSAAGTNLGKFQAVSRDYIMGLH